MPCLSRKLSAPGSAGVSDARGLGFQAVAGAVRRSHGRAVVVAPALFPMASDSRCAPASSVLRYSSPVQTHAARPEPRTNRTWPVRSRKGRGQSSGSLHYAPSSKSPSAPAPLSVRRPRAADTTSRCWRAAARSASFPSAGPTPTWRRCMVRVPQRVCGMQRGRARAWSVLPWAASLRRATAGCARCGGARHAHVIRFWIQAQMNACASLTRSPRCFPPPLPPPREASVAPPHTSFVTPTTLVSLPLLPPVTL